MKIADDLAESQRACTRIVEGQLLQGTDLLNLVLIADSAPDAELVDDAEEVLGAVLLAQHGVQLARGACMPSQQLLRPESHCNM